MRKMLKWLFFSVLSLVLLVAIVSYVLVTQIDFNKYKETVISVVSEATGRKLEIGEISVKVSFRPELEVSQVSLSNAEWAKNPLMVKADKVYLGLNLLQLFNKKYEISNFYVKNMVLNMEESAVGEVNWNFSSSTQVKNLSHKFLDFSLIKNANAEEMSSNQDVSELLSALVIKNVELDNVKINYLDKKQKETSYLVNSLSLAENLGGNIDFKVNINDGQYTGEGEFGKLNMLDNSSGYPVKTVLNIDGINLDVDAKIWNVFDDFKISADVQANSFLGKQYNEQIAVLIEGGLEHQNIIVKSLKLAGNEITGRADIDLSQNVPAVSVKLFSDGIDISSFAKKEQQTLADFFVKSASATTLVPDTVIPYNLFHKVLLKAQIDVKSILMNKKVIVLNLVADASVADGTITLNILNGVVAKGSVRAHSVLRATDESVLLDLDLNAVDIQNLTDNLGIKTDVLNMKSEVRTDVYVNLIGYGNTYSKIVDSLTGQSIVIVDNALVHLGNIGIMKGNILTQLFNTLNLTKGNDDLDVRCAVVRADFDNGKVNFPNSIVINADKFTVVASGKVNLKKDKLDISVKPFSGKITDTNIAKAISSLVKLTGTLQKPKIGVDSVNALKTIVGVTTAGPVYLGSQMLLENDGAPCYTALQGTKFENKFDKPESLVQDTKKDVGKIFDDSVGAVKNTTKELLNIFSGTVKKK